MELEILGDVDLFVHADDTERIPIERDGRVEVGHGYPDMVDFAEQGNGSHLIMVNAATSARSSGCPDSHRRRRPAFYSGHNVAEE